jgi:hypothetical protein
VRNRLGLFRKNLTIFIDSSIKSSMIIARNRYFAKLFRCIFDTIIAIKNDNHRLNRWFASWFVKSILIDDYRRSIFIIIYRGWIRTFALRVCERAPYQLSYRACVREWGWFLLLSKVHFKNTTAAHSLNKLIAHSWYCFLLVRVKRVRVNGYR